MSSENWTNDSPGSSNVKKESPERAAFDALFPELVEVLTRTGLEDASTSQAFVWFKRVLEENVPFGKKNRGLSVVDSYRHLVAEPSPEDLEIARVLGWCVEMLQASMLVADDVMDNSLTRRGNLCWYKQKDVGLIAVNDAFYLESCVYQLLRRLVRDKPYYMEVVELFLQSTSQTVTGQCLDLTTAPPESQVDFSRFTTAQYAAIVKWKTAFYSFYLPVALAMHMAGVSDELSVGKAKDILLKIGHIFQVQDDYLDCYGTPEIIGKIGTDIQDNKCSWLIVTALELASPEQIQTLKNNYGRWDEASVQKVKDVYNDLGLPTVYKLYEEKIYQELHSLIFSLKDDNHLPTDLFVGCAQNIYKRKK